MKTKKKIEKKPHQINKQTKKQTKIKQNNNNNNNNKHKKLWNMSSCSWFAWNVLRKLVKGTGRIGNRRKNRDHRLQHY